MVNAFRTKEKGILFTFAIAAGLKNVSVKRIFQTALAVWCVSYIPTVLLTTHISLTHIPLSKDFSEPSDKLTQPDKKKS